jgi:hypothetical protein
MQRFYLTNKVIQRWILNDTIFNTHISTFILQYDLPSSFLIIHLFRTYPPTLKPLSITQIYSITKMTDFLQNLKFLNNLLIRSPFWKKKKKKIFLTLTHSLLYQYRYNYPCPSVSRRISYFPTFLISNQVIFSADEAYFCCVFSVTSVRGFYWFSDSLNIWIHICLYFWKRVLKSLSFLRAKV